MYPWGYMATQQCSGQCDGKCKEDKAEVGTMDLYLALVEANKLPSVQDRAELLRKKFVILPREDKQECKH